MKLSSASEHIGGLPIVHIALGILRLGVLVGIVAAVGGGHKDRAAPSAPTGFDLTGADDTGSS